MIKLGKFFLIWLGSILILVACSTSETNLTAESMGNAEVEDETMMETAVSPSATTSQPTHSPTSDSTNTPTTQAPEPVKANLPNLGIAPEIENEVWLNTNKPVTLASQRGKVVLLEFWTFG